VHCRYEGKNETPERPKLLKLLVYAALSYLDLLVCTALSYLMLLVYAAFSYYKGCVHCKSEGKNENSRKGRS